MNHNQQTSLTRYANNYEALFVEGVNRIWDRDGQRVIEDSTRLRKSDAVFPPV
jgi:hypothetical protein